VQANPCGLFDCRPFEQEIRRHEKTRTEIALLGVALEGSYCVRMVATHVTMLSGTNILVSRLVILILCLAASSRCTPAQDANATPATNPVTSAGAGTPGSTNQLCTIAGTVTSLATGEPLHRAHVVLSAEGQNPRPQLATTDAAGHFALENVRPGRYGLVVYRDGYLPTQYGETNSDDQGAVLSLVPGQEIGDLVFRLQRTAVISGRVIDEDGEPMVRASVEALKRTRTRGSFQLESSGSAQTDDLGEYRIYDLSPGHYVVRATLNSPNSGFYVSRGDDSEQQSLQLPPNEYPPSYFPGTTDAARASLIDVKAGEEVPRVDFSFAPGAPVKTYRISGRVTNALAAENRGFVMVMAVPKNRDDSVVAEPNMRLMAQPDTKTGAFTITGAPAGSYVIVASSVVPAGEKVRTAMQDIDVTNSDVDGVSLVLTQGAEISGRVTLQGAGTRSAERLKVEIVAKGDEQGSFGARQEADVQKDGSFVLTGVGDGTYTIGVNSKCDECYTKSATANGVDLLQDGLVVRSGQGMNSVEVVYSSNTGKATGTVTGTDGLPMPGAYVVLVKDADGKRTTGSGPVVSASGTTDQNGRFEIRGMPPGKYKALAFQKYNDEASSDPDFLQPLVAKADSFEVEGGATATLQLKAIAPTDVDSSN